MDSKQLRQAIGRLPRVRLAHLPTPLEECRRYAEKLGGPRIYIKRDDCTGLAMGGNKTRILEFTIGRALEQGADVLIGGASSQSNHCRQLAAAAAKLGVECHIVLAKDHKSSPKQGNLLLDDLLGAQTEMVAVDSIEDLDQTKQAVADRLRAKGRRPFIIMQASMRRFGAMGYALCMAEIAEQFRAIGKRLDCLIVCSSSATQPGLVFANKVMDLGVRIIGVAPIKWSYDLKDAFLGVLQDMAETLEMEIAFTPDDLETSEAYVGDQGYGYPAPAANQALRLLAQTEGIIADPIYSAKALAALVDLVGKNTFEAEENVAFLHTGGTPALFAYAEEICS